ncbi:hypothetical protein EDD27_8250 [Nonomuraea polychroma]|uniref:Uncharacterized protein n=1 Tax=Nonomuraea polychroma TaxID=46176 RepID=A0A438MJ75_9ACTN|nr:hypothetical protein [Nonomuraea polychroma]RVX45451.1 hypothetical protein EDD27_8250 [Nonomuraea polychroma]
MTGLEHLPDHKCPTCRTKGSSTLDQATQQVTCGECGQSSLVLVAADPEPANPARRARSPRRRRAT